MSNAPFETSKPFSFGLDEYIGLNAGRTSTVPTFDDSGRLLDEGAHVVSTASTTAQPSVSSKPGLSFSSLASPVTSVLTGVNASNVPTSAASKPVFSFRSFDTVTAPAVSTPNTVAPPAISSKPGFSFGSLASPFTSAPGAGPGSTPRFQFGSSGAASTSTTLSSKPTGTPTSAFSFATPTSSKTTFAPGLSVGNANLSFSGATLAGTTALSSSSAVNSLSTTSVAQATPFSLAVSTTATTASPFTLDPVKSSTTTSTTLGSLTATSNTTGTPEITTTTTATGFSLGGNLATNTVLPVTNGTETMKAQPTLTYRQLEDLVNKWTYELDEQERNFSTELNRLNKADRVLIENAEKISSLQATVDTCKCGQDRIEQELEFVESQQRELENLLEPLEQAATDLPPSQQHADVEREAIFQMCINTDLELGQLLNDLREMAERVNTITNDLSDPSGSSNSSSISTAGGVGVDAQRDTSKQSSTNVIGQVTRILNSHMHSLSWLNQNTQELMEKMKFFATS